MSLCRAFSLGFIILTCGCSQSQNPANSSVKPGPRPDFAAMTDVKVKKAAFFEFLLERVQIVNQEISIERDYIRSVKQRSIAGKHLSKADTKRLRDLGRKYGLEDTAQINDTYFARLLKRADHIPPSLVLAQGANESAWGTSRFAKEANNFFSFSSMEGGNGDFGTFRSISRSIFLNFR